MKIHIYFHFEKFVIEHIEANEAAIQAAIDKVEQKFRENTAALAEAEKGVHP